MKQLNLAEAKEYQRLTTAGGKPGRETMEKARANLAQQAADQAENANVAKVKAGPAPKAPAAPKASKPSPAARVARQAGSRFTSSAKGSATAPIVATGSVLGAFVVAFAAVLMLSILVIPRAGGGSGAGAVGTLLNVADQAMSGFSNSEPFFKEVSS